MDVRKPKMATRKCGVLAAFNERNPLMAAEKRET